MEHPAGADPRVQFPLQSLPRDLQREIRAMLSDRDNVALHLAGLRGVEPAGGSAHDVRCRTAGPDDWDRWGC